MMNTSRRRLSFNLLHKTRSLLNPNSFRSLSDQSWLSVPGNPLANWPPPPPSQQQQPLPSSSNSIAVTQTLNFSQTQFDTIADLLKNPSLSSGSALQSALDSTAIEPDTCLIEAVFSHFDSSPKLLHTLFLWADNNKPGFKPSASLFNKMINVLSKAREFDHAWSMVLDRIRSVDDQGTALVSLDTFVIIIRRYARAAMTGASIRTFEFASNLEMIGDSDSRMRLFEILLDSLCKEGHVRVAAECFDRKKILDSNWIPSVRVYNILLNGWLKSRKLNHAEKLWLEIKNGKVKPSVVSYGTLIEGYCRMRRVDKAMQLLGDMRNEKIEPNAIVYNPIIDALAEEGKFKEALGMMERFLVCESGPTLSTFNSMVKGFCKAEDLAGASKMLKLMINRGFLPTPTTYNYFFRHFAKFKKIEEGMNLYTKMIESGYTPDRLTYHLLLKMLCEDKKLELAIQVSKEMRTRGFDMDLAVSTMLIHLLCNVYRFDEAMAELQDMIRRGIVPQYLTFQKMKDEFHKRGLKDMSRKLSDMMSSVPHWGNLPNTYFGNVDRSRDRRRDIIRRAEVMSDRLKTCNDPRELVKLRKSTNDPVSVANRLIEEIGQRI
ncbi:hypothetical protein ACFE04_018046 [Oxalis oulophora]